jgi:WD40 repeat protein
MSKLDVIEFSLPAGIEFLTYVPETSFIGRFSWSPDGTKLAVPMVGGVRICGVFPPTTPKEIRIENSSVTALTWAPDGKRVALAFADERLRVWNLDEAVLECELSFAGRILDLAWTSRDGQNLLASASTDGNVCIWDLNLFQLMKEYAGHVDRVVSVAWRPGSGTVASSSLDGDIRLWDLEGRSHRTLAGRGSRIYDLTWSKDGRMLACACSDDTVRLWDVRAGKQIGVLEGHINAVTDVCFSPNGQLLASKGSDGATILWRWDTWEPIAAIREPQFQTVPVGLEFSPTQPILATVACQSNQIKIWSIDHKKILKNPSKSKVVYYTNAKVVLVGETGVGKSALGIVLSGGDFVATESTHGRHVWTFGINEVILDKTRKETRETLL